MFDFSPMDTALQEADVAFAEGEVPVGAAVLKGNELIARGHNRVIALSDPTAHAEVLAIRQACERLKTHMLIDCAIYVTLEPCALCVKAIMLSRIKKIYFGAYNIKTGAVFHGENMLCLHQNMLEVIGGIREIECSQSLDKFFLAHR